MVTIYEALAEPMRRRILDLLRERPHMVGELVERLEHSQPLVSKHLRVLREVGLVRARQDAQRRWYELQTAPLVELDAWLGSYRHLWTEGLERLDEYLVRLQDQDKEQNDDQSHRDR